MYDVLTSPSTIFPFLARKFRKFQRLCLHTDKYGNFDRSLSEQFLIFINYITLYHINFKIYKFGIGMGQKILQLVISWF